MHVKCVTRHAHAGALRVIWKGHTAALPGNTRTAAPRRNTPHCTAPHRTAPHRTAPRRIALHCRTCATRACRLRAVGLELKTSPHKACTHHARTHALTACVRARARTRTHTLTQAAHPQALGGPHRLRRHGCICVHMLTCAHAHLLALCSLSAYTPAQKAQRVCERERECV